jgi:quercetin dioxygenase-like cupin family protein
MNKGHVDAGEVVNLDQLRKDLDVGMTHALVRTETMEVIRIVLPKRKTINEHKVDGEISLQCLKGNFEFNFGNITRNLTKEDWLFLEKGVPHSLTANEDSVLLLTILFPNHQK